MQWYYNEGSERRGPVSHEEMQGLIAQGAVGVDNLAWREGMANWVRVGDLPELASFFQASQAAAEPPITEAQQPPAGPSAFGQPAANQPASNQPASPGFGSYASGSSAQGGGVHSIHGDRQRMQYGVPENNGFAIASLVLGILSLLMFCCCGFVLGIPGVICGQIARVQIGESEGRQTGDGLALAGLIISCIGTALSIGFFIYSLVTAEQRQGFQPW